MIKQRHPSASPTGRREAILHLIGHDGECSVEQLAGRFKVSGMTIRRDLQELAEAGRVIRTHGGAALTARVSFEFRFLEEAREHADAKDLVAARAAALVDDGQVVMLDSGTTTLAIARRLKSRANLTVITTSLPIASELYGCPGVELLLLGGRLRRDSPDLTGPVTESTLEMLKADIAFIGADGVDAEGNVYNASPAVGQMLGKMAAAAQCVYVVADHTKVGRTAMMRFGDVKNWRGLITDDEVDPALKRKMVRAGVKFVEVITSRAKADSTLQAKKEMRR